MPTNRQILRTRQPARRITIAVFALFAAVAATTGMSVAEAMKNQLAQASATLTVFVGPVVYSDSIWMADAKGFYKEEGLDVILRPFPSGTTALETFKTGEGDIVMNGELPSVRYWAANSKDYRLIFIAGRDSENQIAIASKSIASAQDLRGKVVATRVGSTGSWFISEYLRKNGVDEAEVTVKNLDTQVLPTALCQGDIDAFFIWQPFGQRTLEICPDEAHLLTTGEGYVHGYNLGAARPGWLAANRDVAMRFLRATLRGRAVAVEDFPAVAEYVEAKFGMNEATARSAWDVMERPFAFDETFYQDYCRLTQWMRDGGMLDMAFDFSEFVWLDFEKELMPESVVAPPSGC